MKKILSLFIFLLLFIGCEEFVGQNISVSIDDSSYSYLEFIICEKVAKGHIKANVIRIDGTSTINYNYTYNLVNNDGYYNITTLYNINTGSYENKIEKIPISNPIKIEITVNADSMETNCSLKYNGREYLLAKYKEFDNPYLWYDTSKKQYDAYQKARKEFNASKYD